MAVSRSGQGRIRTASFLAVGLAAVALALVAYFTDMLESPELSTVDTRFDLRGDQAEPGDLAVVAVDDVTFDELGEQWPFPRSLHAKAIDRLKKDGAKVIAYDVQFTEATDPDEDNALADAVDRGRPVVLGTTEVDRKGHTNILGGDDVLKELGAVPASTVVDPDPLRKFARDDSGLDSLGVAAVVAGGGQVDRSGFDDDGNAWIDYRGGPRSIETVPFSRVVNGKFKPGTFKGRTVVVGAAAPSLQDVHSTSTTGKGELMSGPEVQAHAIWTAAHGLPLKPGGGVLSVLLIALAGLVAPAASLRLRPGPALLAAVGFAVVYLLIAYLAFLGGLILPVLYPLLALGLSAVGALGIHLLLTAFERQRTRDLFARFVPEQVVDQTLERTDDGLRLGGVRRQTTILFSDLRGFTSFSEELEPDRVIEVLNRYLGSMSDEIMSHGGTLVTYMGDGIMAAFGAPLEQPDHADRALAAARGMIGPRLREFNEWMEAEGMKGFRMGVGLNSGDVMAGNVGSERRMEYTTIGDTTNTAARLEGMTKGTEHMLFIAESTKELLRDPPDDLEFFEEMSVRGRTEGIRVWSVPDP